MDADQAARVWTSYLEAIQAWERAQVLIADAAALCEVALAAQARSEELRILHPAGHEDAPEVRFPSEAPRPAQSRTQRRPPRLGAHLVPRSWTDGRRLTPMDTSTDRCTVAAAAKRLGVSKDSIYKRISRGTLPVYRVDGRTYVVLDGTAAATAARDGRSARTDGHRPSEAWPRLVAALEAQVAAQAVELEARRREVKELHVLLERAQRLALPAPRDDALPSDGTASRPWWAALRWWQR
jgi:excisionase family DNA binding protein